MVREAMVGSVLGLGRPDWKPAWGNSVLIEELTCYSLLSYVPLFAIPWTAARQASLSLIISWSSPKFMSINLVMPSNNLILCYPILLLPSIFPSIRVFSSKSTVHFRWPLASLFQWTWTWVNKGFPDGTRDKEQCRRHKRHGSHP